MSRAPFYIEAKTNFTYGNLTGRVSVLHTRSGVATSAAAGGPSERAIMYQTGHRSTSMVRRYIREADLFAPDNGAAPDRARGRRRAIRPSRYGRPARRARPKPTLRLLVARMSFSVPMRQTRLASPTRAGEPRHLLDQAEQVQLLLTISPEKTLAGVSVRAGTSSKWSPPCDAAYHLELQVTSMLAKNAAFDELFEYPSYVSVEAGCRRGSHVGAR
jgi:hypothetical protein